MWWTATFEQQWTVSLLPRDTSTTWEVVLDVVDADLAARDPVALVSAARSDEGVPLPWLPYLAEERSVDEFSSAWPEERQRAVTKASRSVHQVKGTRPALDRAMTPLGFSVKVVEWFEVQPPRQPYTFRLSLTVEPMREWLSSDRSAFIRTANKAKNAHTKLEAIEVRRNVGPVAVYVGGTLRRVRTIRVGQLPKLTTIRADGFVFVGAVHRRRRTLRVGPRP